MQILLTRLNFESFVIHFGRAINRSAEKQAKDWFSRPAGQISARSTSLYHFLLSTSGSTLLQSQSLAVFAAAQAVAKSVAHSLCCTCSC